METKKLVLKKEVIARLDNTEMSQIAGGGFTDKLTGLLSGAGGLIGAVAKTTGVWGAATCLAINVVEVTIKDCTSFVQTQGDTCLCYTAHGCF